MLVGHKSWGKSRTLKAQTNDNYRVKHLTISGTTLFIRRMSNDDKPSDFREFVRGLQPDRHQFVILAFCPVFSENADEILRDLQGHYDIHSFVLRRSFDGARQIAPNEIESLGGYGPVEVFNDREEAPVRAAALRAFLRRNIPR